MARGELAWRPTGRQSPANSASMTMPAAVSQLLHDRHPDLPARSGPARPGCPASPNPEWPHK
ncbi:hypothetical protein EYW47_14410 [Paraburkholderia silviterrae]|uniref:Uncharacterized protein n=1 Tax=Paraburkholderia silviterrae TaxID=2528715 RepID=A0A4R5MAL3_9BURK|nr:hypothetical protein EYW47_14410 [Paraburkholderia silviterrae]